MGLLSKIFGADKAIDGLKALGNIVDEIWTSKEEKMGHEEFMAKLAQQPGLVQLEINKLEAQHRSIFVAGWRPFIGWVCGLGFLWAFLGQPLFSWVVLLMGETIVPPSIPTENMMELVLALPGLGGLRTYEKIMGRTK